VLPGGHVDPGEGLIQCCIRELHEECGIKFDQDKDGFTYKGKAVTIEPHFGFESVGTPKLNGGLPPFSHLIVFWKVQLPFNSEDV